ncbi:MAG: GAF domain-containing sensor histidine kinase [Archangium sp.]|nr:GAF domain-containing sensor histidine kinase [Archangium sp.]
MDRPPRGNARTEPAGVPAAARAQPGHEAAERLFALLEVGSQISSARDVDSLLAAVMERLTGLLRAEAATLFMHDRDSRELWGRVLKGQSLKEIRIPDSLGIAGHVFSSGRTLMLGDAYNDARFNPEIDRQSGFKTRSIIATPLRHLSGQVLGVLQVLDRRADAFTPEDRALVEGVATQVASVLEHVLLVDELKRRGEELALRISDLDALYEVEKAVSSASAQTDLLEQILAIGMERVGAQAGSILLMEEDRDALFFRTAKGERSEALVSLRLKTGQGIAGHVAESGEVVRVKAAEDSEFHDRSIARRLGLTTGAVLCVPVGTGNRAFGALELLNKKGGFTEQDEHLAVLLAAQVGRALQRRQSQEEVERRSRLATIGQMLSGVLHDLRTPLTVVGGYAEMMAGEDEPALRAEMSAQILNQLNHISDMQQETLAFVRGEKSVFIRRVFMHVFMKELTEQLQQEFAGSSVELRVHAGYTGAARFDESKIKRVIFNLSRNAIDAMPDGGRFLLSVEREGDDIVFRAKDNGPGIPKEIADRLFESFVTSGKKHGTGLGLAIVKKIAKEHGGTVTCKTQIGKGTSFEVRLPAGTPAD